MEISEKEDPEGCLEDRIRPYFFELLQHLNLLRFGKARGNVEPKEFLSQLEALYEECRCTPSEGLMMAECHLEGSAAKWWKAARETVDEQYGGNLWEQFKRAFTDAYLPRRCEPEVEEGGPSKKRTAKIVKEISGMIKIEGHLAHALFDTGSTHSHVDEEYAQRHGLALSEFQTKEKVVYADGRRSFVSKVCRESRIEVGELCTLSELTVSRIKPLDVLIGMDWLVAYHAHINCRKGEIEFRMPGKPIFKFQGDQSGK